MGPLAGIKIVELGGIGPGPFCCMMLADMGAEVIRVERVSEGHRLEPGRDPTFNIWYRGRRSIRLDLQKPEGIDVAWKLIERSDVLVEGFRPGVAERLGLGPDVCLARNPRLVYGRMTGWGQEGPLADAAGHDIAYIALTGALHAVGYRNQPPPPPLNLVGDLGGGGAFLAYGIACALVERASSGKGQIVDAAIVDGVASLLAFDHGSVAAGSWSDDRESNLLDGGTPWYATYETKDGKYVAIGALEPQFYAELLRLTGLDRDPTLPDRRDKAKWPVLRDRLAALFRGKTRDEWCALLEGTDACFAPVLSLSESQQHPHMIARDVYVTLDGVRQPRPAPRFSRTNHTLNVSPPPPGKDTDDVLSDIGFTAEQVKSLRTLRVVS